MARLWQGGAELNSVTDGIEIALNSGTMSISSTTVRSGTYAWRANPTTSTGFWRHIIFTVNQNTHAYLRVYLFITSLPTVTVQLLRFSSATNVTTARIDLTTTGTLLLKNAASAQVGSASSALSTGQWYRIELELDASSSPGSLAGYIDGSSFASGANSSQGSWGRILWGAISPSTTTDLFFDDVALNDASGGSQTGLPGAGKLLHLRPNAAGDANSFAVQVGGTAGGANNFTRVNEVIPDDATTYNGSLVLSQEDLFNCDNSGIQSYDTVNTVLVGGRIADLVSADATTAFKFELEKTGSGTKTQSAAIIPNTTTFSTNAGADPRTYPIITYTDPDAAAWTGTTLDSMQIGYTLTATNVQTIAVSTVWASVDYTPGTPPAASVGDTFLMMGI